MRIRDIVWCHGIIAQICRGNVSKVEFRSPGKVPVDPVDGEDAVLDGGNVVVLKEEDAVGVLYDGAGVAGEEVLHRVPVRGVDLFGVTLRNPARKMSGLMSSKSDTCHPCQILVIHVRFLSSMSDTCHPCQILVIHVRFLSSMSDFYPNIVRMSAKRVGFLFKVLSKSILSNSFILHTILLDPFYHIWRVKA